MKYTSILEAQRRWEYLDNARTKAFELYHKGIDSIWPMECDESDLGRAHREISTRLMQSIENIKEEMRGIEVK